MKKILLTGGGTAGHIYPALAIKERLEKEGVYEFFYIGSQGMEKDIVSREKNIKFYEIDAVKLQRKLTLKNLLIPFKLFSSIKSAKKILKEIFPDVIFSKGGFVALPVAFAGKRCGIPVVSHESDLSMGLANKLILKACDKMCVSFEKTCHANKKCVFTGQPIRENILRGNKNNIKQNLFSLGKKNLLVIGGSSGAGFLNNLVKENINQLREKYNIFHIVGKNNPLPPSQKNYYPVNYFSQIGDAYAWADLVLSRAGSGVINELLEVQKPMLLIPLSKNCSRGDQVENALLFQEKGYAICMQEEEYNSQKLLNNLDNLIKNDKIFKNNMQKSIKNDACSEIIKALKEVCK